MEGRIVDEEEPTRTELGLSERYEFSQLFADPMTPKLVDRHLRRID